MTKSCHENVFPSSRACIHRDEALPETIPTVTAVEQYPSGTDDLWMAHYRSNPDGGDMNGPSYTLDGTLQEACAEAQRIAEREGLILQCLRRRY